MDTVVALQAVFLGIVEGGREAHERGSHEKGAMQTSH
jgi:hypothetical protein